MVYCHSTWLHEQDPNLRETGATFQGSRHSWSAVEVTCRLRRALDHPLLKVQYLLYSIGEAATHSNPLVPMKTQGSFSSALLTRYHDDRSVGTMLLKPQAAERPSTPTAAYK